MMDFFLRISGEHYLLALAAFVIVILSAASVTLAKLARELRQSEARWKFALEGAGEGVWDWNIPQNKVTLSPRYEEIVDFNDEDTTAHETTWHQHIHPDDRDVVDLSIKDYLAGHTASYYNEHRILCRDGTVKWVLARGMIVSHGTNEKPLRMIGTLSDITVRKTVDERMHYRAHYDPLTNLPNRALMSDRLQQAVIKARRDHSKMALMFIDLDKFKPVNDTLGHEAGDLLLQQVAIRLLAGVRESDTVARIGGDEFVVLLHAIDQEDDASMIAEKILHSLNTPFTVGKHEVRISGSIGIAAYPQHGEDEKVLLINADIAMYQAKKEGRNGYRFFTQESLNELTGKFKRFDVAQSPVTPAIN
ncbi:MAG: sensor domain-containing diguanylate cyclase [Nitrosomonadales bacterium]|jgi:diguanylate cyclase (GGDEF)-like protein/PAS domain S-box-containing protein